MSSTCTSVIARFNDVIKKSWKSHHPFHLEDGLREQICDAAVKLMRNVDYINAGTVEFLVADGRFYFIEVNPRIQVEHTITEMVTGIDIVHAQIHIADGKDLHEGEAGCSGHKIKSHYSDMPSSLV